MRICRIALIGVACMLAASQTHADELEGRWSNGSWIDTNTGHEGPLRGYFTPTSDCNYRAVFTGKFAKVIPFRMKTTLNVVGRDGDKTYLGGESRFPLMGRFTYSGVADGQNFNMQYDSRRWRGEFNLNR